MHSIPWREYASLTMNSFGAASKEWRMRRRLSQLELALRAGTTQRHVSFLESGRSVPGRGMAPRILNFDD